MKKQNNFKYSIVIPTYNHCDDLLKPCLDSIVAHSNMSETEIVVVANGCVDNTRSYVTELKQQYPSVNLVWFDEGIGFTKATNAGIKVAQGKFVLLLNNDTVIYGKNWLDTLSEPFSDSNVGATGIHEIYSAEIKHNFLVGYCLMTRREMFEEVGMLDEIFSPGFGEDIDFCAKILAKGYKLVNVDANQKMNGILMVGTFPLYHKGSSTFHDEEHNVKYEKIVHRNIGILQERYSKPQVNIIIPTYKRYELLKECLDSVLQQTYKKINVIVVSDGYDTTTESIVNSYSDERIKFNFYNTTEHEGNFGSKPRIYGIEQLDDSGYVCFLDDDNILYPEYIEKMVNNDGQISICKITTVLTEENLFKTIPAVENSIPSLGDIDSLNFMVPNVVAKKCKEKWNQVGPDIRHDYDFISECMKTENGKFKYIPEILAEHRLIQSARNGKTKFLVTLVNYGEEQLNYLNQVIDSFKSFDESKYEIDIVVHSNIDIDRKDVDVVVHKEAPGFLTANGEVYKDWLYFPWVCRQTIYDRRNDYDIFLYNENDHLYTQKNVDSFLEMSRILPDDKVAGFMRYEEYPEMKMGKFYPDYFYMNEWKFNSTFKIGNEIFAEFSNLHHGGFLLTKSQLNKVIENSVIFTGESKFLNPFRRIEISQYMPRERACVDVYESGLTKVIPISRFEDFCVHHLPNVYLERLGIEGGRFDSNVMKPAVDKMLSGHKMKYSIVIPTYNHCEDLLKPCIESIIANTDLSETEVIVMANGCVDNTVEYVKSLGFPFKLIYHKEQLGYTKATNFGLQAASGEYIVLLNNDVVIQPHPVGWLNLLREPFDDNEKVGMTGPLLFKGVEGVSNDFIMFFCAMTTRKIIDEVGYLDEIFAPGGVEDVDYGLRLTLAGYELVEVSSVSNRNHSLNMGAFPIYHPGNSTYSHEEGWNEILVRNNEILKNKFPEHFKGLEWIEKMKHDKIMQDLPNGWFESDEIERLRELTQKIPDNGIMVQIGVYLGKSVCALKDLILQKNLTVLAVDVFECNELGFFKDEFEQNIKNFNLENNVKTYMMTSVEASKYVSDKSVDLIFIDADHTYDAVKLDIQSWSPKLKHDGIICGHDYSTWHGVKLAVDEAFGENVENIKGVWSLKNDRNLHQEMLNEDELTYKEIFEINVNQVDPQELVGKTIIDVGANKGYFAIYCAERGAKQVYSFEPVKSIYKRLEDFTSGFDNIHTHNLAILDGSIDEVYMYEAGACSNIWGKEGEPTRCISLKEALESVDYKTDMILKLDCEGSEYEILFNTPKEIIRQFGIIYLEVHNEMNPNYMNKHEELLNYITSLGYNAKKGPQAGTSYPDGTWVPGPISLWKLTRHEENITIGYIDYDREVFNSHLCKSIKDLDGIYDIVDIPASGKAAKDYNDIVKKSDNRYVLLIHQDMEIPADFLESVRKTINEHPDFGVLGLVGYDSFENHNRNTIFSEIGKTKEAVFFDSCCILINKDHNIQFDEETFDELHMYVEDYCMQAIQKGLKNYTFNVSYESTKHAGATYYKTNEMWGRYGEYYEKFMNKWKQIHFLDSLEENVKPQHPIMYDELFSVNVYCDEPLDFKNKTLIDIGGYRGFYTLKGLKNGIKNALVFEPQLRHFDLTKKNLELFPQVQVFNKAVADKNTKSVSITNQEGASNIYITENIEKNDDIECITLAEILKDCQPNKDGFILKLDCEGAEYDIIQDTTKEELSVFDFIFFEVHDNIHPNPKYNQEYFLKMLNEKGFEMVARGPSYGTWYGDVFVPGISAGTYKFKKKHNNVDSLLPELKKDDDIVFYEIFERNMYMVNADELKNSTVIDLGANIGMFSLLALKHDAEKIYSYEPNHINYERLKRYTESFNNIQPINLAVCGKSGTVYVNGADMKGTSSINNEDGEYPVECITLESIIDERNEKDLVLKIDVEGSEYDILYSCPSEKLKRFNTIYAEFHDNIVFDKDELNSKDALKKYIVDLGYNVEVSPEVLWGYKHDGTAEPMTNISTLKFIRKDNKPKVYDCFPFFNELDLLEIRLNELDNIVDKFVITESRTTHSGKPKPMYLSDNLNRFEKFKDKIVIIDTDLENIPQDAQMNPDWIREHMQRDGCIEYLKSVCKPSDYVIVSDADEIPTEAAIRKYISDNTDKVGVLVQSRYMYFLNYKNIQTDEPQLNSKILKYELFNPFDLNAVRYSDKENIMPTYRIENAGWHFTFMGGVDKVIEKIKAFAHQEYNTEEKINYERMLKLFETGKDVYSANTSWTLVGIDENFPKLVQQNKDEYISRGWIKEKFNEEKQMNENLKVTATVSTRNRYFSTLPTCIQAIALQNHVPDELIIYDDNPEDKRIDLRNESLYQNLFSLLSARGINWAVSFGSGEGQVKNHQRALTEAAHELIWRLDDDNAPAPNVLETLLKYMKKDTGAVAGLILDPKSDPKKNPIASNKIEDIYFGLNEQWYMDDFGYKEVDHLYSSFLFRKAAASHGYEKTLSRVGHREETIFTYQMKVNGWKVGITSECITWHYNNPQGGIRDNTKMEMWKHDEDVFSKKMKEWGISGSKKSFIVLNNGIGDHYAFKTLLPKIKEKYKNIVLATCYPEIFEDDKEIAQISIAEAVTMLGDLSQWDIYKFMADNNWKESIIKAYEKMYLS